MFSSPEPRGKGTVLVKLSSPHFHPQVLKTQNGLSTGAALVILKGDQFLAFTDREVFFILNTSS